MYGDGERVKRTRSAALEASGDDQPGPADGALLRLCAVTRVERSIPALIRFVAAPDGQITPDIGCRLPGRGVWVTATRDAVTVAVKRAAFAKSLKHPVTVSDDLPDLVDRLLAQRARQSLSFANKAGLVVTGFMKVSEALDAGAAMALIAASDGAPDGLTKLERKFRAIHSAKVSEGASLAPVADLIITDFTGEDLDLAIGRSNVIHGALATGAQSRIVLNDSLRLRRFRSNTVLEERANTANTPLSAATSGSHSSQADDYHADGMAAQAAASEQGSTDTV
jgi:uncharacterized protein